MVKLAALGVLLYTTFWLALVMVCVMVVAWMARNTDLGEELPEPEWRNGPAGFGLYTYDGFRIDPHVGDDSSDHFFDTALIAMLPPLPPAALASPVAPARPLQHVAGTNARPQGHDPERRQYDEHRARDKHQSMSPKALFSPTSGSKLVCGRFQPNPQP